MSFFHEPGNDSNLQYDNTAFLYFLATSLLMLILTLTTHLLNTLLHLPIKLPPKLTQNRIFTQKVKNLESVKFHRGINLTFAVKIVLLLLLGMTFAWLYENSSVTQKMKGFDPYDILGV